MAQAAVPSRIGNLPARADFLRVAASRQKFAVPGLVLQVAEAEGGQLRVGFTATKKIGNAVVRNRAKRRLRAIARDIFPANAASAHDYVLIARGGTVARPHPLLVRDLEAALKRLGVWREAASES